MAGTRKKGQADKRTYFEFTDNHGRKFGASVEKDTMHPTGSMTPIGHIEHSFFPLDMQFVSFGALGKMHIDYDNWEAMVVDAHKNFENRLHDTASAMSPLDMGASHIANRPPALVKMMGPAPVPVDFVRASRAGNKWILGIPKPDGSQYPVPQWAEKYMVKPIEIAPDYPDVYEDEELVAVGVEDDRYSEFDEETPVAPKQRRTRMGKER
jgi:hypothetical protein